jgi:dTDP-4-amino-4,6-dideoxygalactose transaminase
MSEQGYEKQFVEEAFASNWIAPLGPMVDGFEQDIIQYTGAKYAVALSSGTAAIHLALKAIGVKQGDIVFRKGSLR